MAGYRCDFDFVMGIDMTNNDDWVIPIPMLVLSHSLPHDRNYFISRQDTLYLISWVSGLHVLEPGPIDVSWFNVLFLYRRCQHQRTDRENGEETEIIAHKQCGLWEPPHRY